MPPTPHRTPRLVKSYRDYLATQNTGAFVRGVAGTYAKGTLSRLALSENIETRRAGVLALNYLGDYEENVLFGRLLHDEDRIVRLLAETGIKSLWIRAEDEQQRQKLCAVIRLVAFHFYEEAIESANILIAESPNYAEAWNQRGVAFFALKKFEETIQDARMTLELNPYHFGAATGMGYAQMQLDRWDEAIESFQHALEINPNLHHIRGTVAQIERVMYKE